MDPVPKQDIASTTFPPTQSVVSFDKHFVVRNANPTCWQFFGSSSPIALAVEVLVHAQSKFGPITHDLKYVGTEFALNHYQSEDMTPPDPRPTPSRTEIEGLIDLYLSTTNVLHGYSDNETVVNDIDIYLRHHGANIKALTGNEAHQYFRVAMICSIASANKARHVPFYAAESIAYYREGLQCVEEVTSDVSPDALQALLLLILFAFFYPRRVDLWKVLDYACRLSVELNYHSETNDEFEDERIRQLRRSLFWGLYCLERTIGQHYGRPSDLPEEIITAEYPATLNVLPFLDQPSQYSLVSHYYRLIYIRSEIFRELYMPATAPDLPRVWYEERLRQMLNWQREFHGIEQIPGMGTMTCRMGFDTSICFLFQPLLLRALVATKDAVLSPDCQEVIPRESYDAAVRAVSFYNTVLRAEPDTPEGRYPITVVSGHYIHQISLTILAFCLLAIDGRLPTVSFSAEPGTDPGAAIDFSSISETCETCLFLLGQVADRFPGMIGMYDICKEVQEKVLHVMIQNGP